MKYNHDGLPEKVISIGILNEGNDKVTNRPNDKGGITKYGISDMRDRVKDGKVHLPNGSMKDVKDLTREDAIAIYTEDYYNPIHAEYLQNESLILEIFDWGVTSGTENVIKKFQKMIGVIPDGNIGEVTGNKANSYPADIVRDFKNLRINFYNKVADLSVEEYKKTHPNATSAELIKYTDEGNRKGWINRVNRLKL